VSDVKIVLTILQQVISGSVHLSIIVSRRDSTTGVLIMNLSPITSANEGFTVIPNCFKDGKYKIAGISAGFLWFSQWLTVQ
jgi:hypothetical protein